MALPLADFFNSKQRYLPASWLTVFYISDGIQFTGIVKAFPYIYNLLKKLFEHLLYNRMYFKKLALIMAMDAEARPMIKRFNLSWKGPLNPRLPMMLYVGKHKKSVINLITSGECSRFMVDHIGTQPAVLSTHLAIDTLSPDIIINPGTAGGFIKANASVGDVYLGHPQVCYHDRRIICPDLRSMALAITPPQSDIIAGK